jgi:Flp pilus assembly protein TadD
VVADLERITATAPVSTQALSDLGVAYFSLGRFDEAMAVFERLAAVMPRNVDVYLNMVRVCVGKGDIDGALRACERALVIEPANAQAIQMRETLRRRLRG